MWYGAYMNVEDMQATLETCLKAVPKEGGKKSAIKINYQKMEARYVCGAEEPGNEHLCTGYASRHDDRCAFRQEDGACAKPVIYEEV